MKKLLLISLFCLFHTIKGLAQCPMCKMAGESNLKNGGTDALGINTGIIYLLMMPYLAIFVVGFVWFRYYQNKSKIE